MRICLPVSRPSHYIDAPISLGSMPPGGISPSHLAIPTANLALGFGCHFLVAEYRRVIFSDSASDDLHLWKHMLRLFKPHMSWNSELKTWNSGDRLLDSVMLYRSRWLSLTRKKCSDWGCRMHEIWGCGKLPDCAGDRLLSRTKYAGHDLFKYNSSLKNKLIGFKELDLKSQA